MLTTSLLSLVPEVADALSDDDVSSDAELLLSVDVVEVVDAVDVVESVAPTEDASLLESLVVEVICGGGGGGGGAMAALVVSPEASDPVVSPVELADEVSDGGGGCIVAASVPLICSWRDKRTDRISLPSDEKALPDDTVPDVELLLCPSEEGGAKAVAADVPLLLDDPERAARLPVVLVRAERDDICCLREKLPLQL